MMTELFSNDVLIVENNSSGEIFVKLKKSGQYLRIGDYRDGLIMTTSYAAHFEPYALNGLPAIMMKVHS